MWVELRVDQDEQLVQFVNKHDVGVIRYCSGEFLVFMTSTSDFRGI